jgi:hypothetical protein
MWCNGFEVYLTYTWLYSTLWVGLVCIMCHMYICYALRVYMYYTNMYISIYLYKLNSCIHSFGVLCFFRAPTGLDVIDVFGSTRQPHFDIDTVHRQIVISCSYP